MVVSSTRYKIAELNKNYKYFLHTRISWEKLINRKKIFNVTTARRGSHNIELSPLAQVFEEH